MPKCVGRPVPPHPGPLPEEREKHRPTLEHCQDIRFADRLATILPLPACRAVASSRRLGGEGRGEGEEAPDGPPGSSAGDARKAQFPLPDAVDVVEEADAVSP